MKTLRNYLYDANNRNVTLLQLLTPLGPTLQLSKTSFPWQQLTTGSLHQKADADTTLWFIINGNTYFRMMPFFCIHISQDSVAWMTFWRFAAMREFVESNLVIVK